MSSWLNGNIPELINSTRILNDGGGLTDRNIIYNKTKYNIANPLIVDRDFFSMFSFDVFIGEIKSFESDKYSVALSKPIADKIFGDMPPLGKTIEYKGELFTVRAVMDEIPPNSSIKFDMLLPASNMPDYVTMDWKNNTLQTFIEAGNLLPGKQLQQKINDGIISTFNSLGYAEQAKSRSYLLNPLDNIYYSASLYDNICVHGDIKTTILLISLVSIVLLIALLNYANIIMSGASESIRNVGIRSVFGSSRTDNIRFLVYQALLPCIIAVTLAFCASIQIKKMLIDFLGIEMPDLRLSYFLIVLVFGLLTGVVIGLFPAVKFTSYKITSSLKKSNDSGKKVNGIGNIFSIVQFTASIVLIISVFTIYRQIDYVLSQSGKNLNDRAVIYMSIANRTEQTAQKILRIGEALKRLPEIVEVSTSLHIPGDDRYSDSGGMLHVKGGEEEYISFNYNMVGGNYPIIMGLEILEGRLFDSENKSDYLSYIVNETFIRQYQIQDISNTSLNGSPIIGVIKDFHYNSLHDKIGPLAIRNEELYQSRILIELTSSEIPEREVIDKITQTVDEIDNTAVSNVNFLDQHIARLYEKEKKVLNILFVLALFSILISGMGLFSMSMLISKIRTKEIVIRKVNGAMTAEVMILLCKEFVKWIALAFIIAIPIAYYAMKTWLENFEYKTGISWWIFALSGILALGIALLTVSWQSWRAATSNPVEALRYE